MSTAAQIAANIANARQSTGPTTDEGKQRSSQNALKHGLTAKATLIPGEDPAEYEQFSLGLLDYWTPADPAEFAHVEEMINIQWRLRRCERLEAKILSVDMPDFKALNNVSLHAARLKRQYTATFNELNLIQGCRQKAEMRNLEYAEVIRRADVIAGRATNLQDFGFDFTVERIDDRIRCRDHAADAARIVAQANLRRAA